MASPVPAAQQPHHLTPDSTSNAAPPEPVLEPAAAGSEAVKEERVEDDDVEVEYDDKELEEGDDDDLELEEEDDNDTELEEEDECGFFVYMKGGGCKDAFTAWKDCLEAAGSGTGGFDDLVQRCGQDTVDLKNCLDAHADYYKPLLEIQQALPDGAVEAIAAAINEKAQMGRAAVSSPSSAPEGDEEGTASS